MNTIKAHVVSKTEESGGSQVLGPSTWNTFDILRVGSSKLRKSSLIPQKFEQFFQEYLCDLRTQTLMQSQICFLWRTAILTVIKHKK